MSRVPFLTVSVWALFFAFIPNISAAAGTPQTFADLAGIIVNLMSAATVVAFIFGIVVYFYGIAFNIPKFSEGSSERLRLFFFWGIIVIVVMVSVFGIVRLMRETVFNSSGSFGGGGGSATTCPFGKC